MQSVKRACFRNFLLTGILLSLCLNCLFAQTVTLEFDEKGRLLSSPPENFTKVSEFMVKVQGGENKSRDLVRTAWNLYFTTLNNLQKKGKEGFFLSAGLLGKTRYGNNQKFEDISCYEAIRIDRKPDNAYLHITAELYLQLKYLIATHPKYLEDKLDKFTVLENKLDFDPALLNCMSVDPRFVPKAATVIVPDYKLLLQFVNDKNIIIARDTIDLSSQGNLVSFSGSSTVNNLDSFGKDVHAIKYELREENPWFTEVDRLINLNPLPGSTEKLVILNQRMPEYLEEVQKGQYKEVYEEALAILAALSGHEDSSIDIVENQNQEPFYIFVDSTKTVKVKKEWVENRLKPTLTKLQEKQEEVNGILKLKLEDFLDEDFFYSFLWLTGGEVLTNPFVYKKEAVVDKRKILENAIEEKKLQLDSLASVESFYEELASNDQQGSPRQAELYIKTYQEILSKKLALKKELSALEKKLKELQEVLASYNMAKLDFQETYFRDKLLYRGILYTAPLIGGRNKCDPGLYVMRNHDALREYFIMNTDYRREVREDQQMKILVQNENYKSKITYDFTFAALEDNDSFLEIELKGLDKQSSDSTFFKIRSYVSLYNQFLVFRYGVPLQIPQASKDEEPAYVTKEAIEDLPPVAPATANYVIKKDEKEVAKGQYRINKLYKFRLKVGAVYSWLEKRDYVINAGSVALNSEPHGLDALFGLQYFFRRQDVRSPKFGLRPNLFLGFGFSDNPIKNWYLGAGIEPFNGVNLMGGFHFGETEDLSIQNDALVTRNVIKPGGYVAIAFDLAVFARLFNISELTNPFKAK